MASRTKMIIITSDEDTIRQFSINKPKNTFIIDLDNDKQETTTQTDDKLSKSDFNNDQIYKRSLDSPQHNPLKPVKTSKKSTDMICAICGGKAIGFNYDALSCGSCKAFFRRNANQDPEKMRCLSGQGPCSVAHEIARKCPKCRLERCFAAGMRKEFILNGEEIQRRKVRLEENRNLTSQRLSTSQFITSSPITHNILQSESLSLASNETGHLFMDIEKVDDTIVLQQDNQSNEIDEMLFGTLPIEDWITIQSVQSSFISVFNVPMDLLGINIDLSNRVSALMLWSEFSNIFAERYINFFRQIDEFQSLLLDDRLILIKYNLLPIFPICKCYMTEYIRDYCSLESTDEEELNRQFFKLFDAPDAVRDTFVDVVLSMIQVTERDPILLSLLLIILILTPGLSMSDEEPPLKDALAVNRAQCHYTKILWNYLVNKWGEIEACKRFTQLLTLILRIQSRNQVYRLFFRNECVKANTVDKLAPLMQSLLNIS